MDMTEFSGGKGSWLTTKILVEKGINEVKAVVKDVRTVDFDDATKPVLDLVSADEDFSFTLNVTNTNTLIEKFGAESDDWVGKDLLIRLEKTDYQGKRVNCLRVV